MDLCEVECNICSSPNRKLIFERERYQINFKIQRCNNCGLVYLNPRPCSSQLSEYYSNVYNYEGFLENHDNLITKSRKDLELIQKYKKEGNLLEIGCMYGFLLDCARKSGFKAYGVEISQKATDYARKNFALDIFNGRLEESSFDTQFFDVIFLSHLLEHLEDPMGTLKIISRILKPDGVLIIKCPNFGSLMSKIMRTDWGWLAPPEHLYHFTPKTITNMLNKAGISDITISTIGGDLGYLRYLTVTALSWLPISKSLINKYRVKIDVQPGHISQRLLLAIYKLCRPVIYLIHKAKLGEEMIVVGRKEKNR
jgi:2-polyprenyl-3-methyl-5-hydroxy-6-metoxy-1,4-benzoquinol methylase